MSSGWKGVATPFLVLLLVSGVAWGETITFDDLPAGFYSGTSGAPDEFELFGDGGTGPILVTGLNPRFGSEVNAAVVFNTAAPSGEDDDLGSPNETCDPPGPGVGDGGELGMPFENCPSAALGNVLIIGEDLDDGNGDDLIDDPDDEGQRRPVQWTFDWGEVAPATVVSMSILDTDESATPPSVQMFDAGNNLLAFIELPMTGDNGLSEIKDLGPTAGVAKMVVVYQGSGALDNLTFIRECVFRQEMPSTTVQQGGTLEYGLYLQHNKLTRARLAFSTWIENRDGERFAVERTRPRSVRPGDEVRVDRSVPLPKQLGPGEYHLVSRIDAMAQGRIIRRTRFIVTE